MDRRKAKMIRKYLEDAFKNIEDDIAKELGVTLKVGNISYSDAYATVKVEASDIGEDGVAVTKEAHDFKLMAHLYGLEPSDLGKSFKVRGREFTIKGLKPRSTKRPILVESDGSMYKMSEVDVKRALGR